MVNCGACAEFTTAAAAVADATGPPARYLQLYSTLDSLSHMLSILLRCNLYAFDGAWHQAVSDMQRINVADIHLRKVYSARQDCTCSCRSDRLIMYSSDQQDGHTSVQRPIPAHAQIRYPPSNCARYISLPLPREEATRCCSLNNLAVNDFCNILRSNVSMF